MATDWPCSALKNSKTEIFRERGLDRLPDRARALVLLRISLRFHRKRRFRFFCNKFKKQGNPKHTTFSIFSARAQPGPGPARAQVGHRSKLDNRSKKLDNPLKLDNPSKKLDNPSKKSDTPSKLDNSSILQPL